MTRHLALGLSVSRCDLPRDPFTRRRFTSYFLQQPGFYGVLVDTLYLLLFTTNYENLNASFLCSHVLELQAAEEMYVNGKLDYPTCGGE